MMQKCNIQDCTELQKENRKVRMQKILLEKTKNLNTVRHYTIEVKNKRSRENCQDFIKRNKIDGME